MISCDLDYYHFTVCERSHFVLLEQGWVAYSASEMIQSHHKEEIKILHVNETKGLLPPKHCFKSHTSWNMRTKLEHPCRALALQCHTVMKEVKWAEF